MQAICRFFNTKEGCRFGERCTYLHYSQESAFDQEFDASLTPIMSYADVVSMREEPILTAESVNSIPKSIETCRFYLSGSCRYGDKCRYSHNNSDLLNRDGSDVSLECRICMGKINGNQIGMLSNCSCLFCINCIRGWRKDGLEISGPSQVR